MPGIFISYRREDCPGHAGRIFDRLRSTFGTDVVFMDVTAIEAGVDFVDVLHKAVGSCDALLAVIGPQWVSAAHGGKRRLDDPRDFVRLEIAGALERNVRVLPVLVEGASVPSTDDLPPDLQALTRRQAVELRDGRWDDDIERLVEGLEKFLKAPASPPQKPHEEPLPPAAPVAKVDPSSTIRTTGRGVAIGAVAALILVVGAVVVWRGGLGQGTGSGTVPDKRGQIVTPDEKVVNPTPDVKPAPPTPTPTPPANLADPPDVRGKTILEAREILRKAGFRFLIQLSGDRSKPPGVIQTQVADEATRGNLARRVVLTAAPMSTVLVHVVKGDEPKADALMAYLKDEPSTIGSVVRSLTVQPRAEGVGRVSYSEERLATQAEAVAKDTNEYLARSGSGRTLQPFLNPRVATGLIIVNLYERAH